jgi:nuclear polyadenylated RNA-binding protein 3
MIETDPTPEILSTAAELSPISPSPVHTTVPLALPVLQDQAESLDSMAAPTSGVEAGTADGATMGNQAIADAPAVNGSDGESIADDDSFNDAYGEEQAGEDQELKERADASMDDYARTFDSPLPAEDEEEGMQEDVSSTRESINAPSSSAALPNLPSVAAPTADLSLNQPASSAPDTLASHPARPEAPDPNVAAESLSHPPPEQPIPQSSPPQSNGKEDSIYGDPASAQADIKQLVADITSRDDESSSLPKPPQYSPTPDAYPVSSNLKSPASASLPPKPQLVQLAAQPISLPTEYQPFQQAISTAHVSPHTIAPLTPGQPSTYVAAGAPGTSTEPISSLPPPPASTLNAAVPITSLTAPPYPSNPPAFSADATHDSDYQSTWDTFLTDERRYMSEARWDRFPEGSRIFIGRFFFFS